MGYVLGTHTSHNGSACLLKDGRIVVAIETERLTRVKHDGGDDNAAIRYCLTTAGITIRDVDLVVQNANFDMFQRGNSPWGHYRLVDEARRVVTISHHLAHAYSAVGTAPFTDTAVLIIDGCGNCYADCGDLSGAHVPERPPNRELEQLYFEKDSYYEYRQGQLRPVMKDFSPAAPHQPFPMYPSTTMHSIGGAYLGVSKYVFGGIEDPGKLMGLAPFGRVGAIEGDMFRLEHGRAFLNYGWMDAFNRPAVVPGMFEQDFQYYADIARWTQDEIERALLYIVRDRYNRCPSEHLAYAGGVALNAVANGRLLKEGPFPRLYVQPAAADNGLAVGCAYYGWLAELGGERVPHDGRAQLGRSYAAQEISTCLSASQVPVVCQRPSDVVAVTADHLAAGRVVGWFQGGAEFGPRALGGRSLLALPTPDTVRTHINRRIKFREDFRPFAPAVPIEEATRYFELTSESPYMTLVARVRPEWAALMPAVVHRDGSARVQTVHAELTPLFHRLLMAVKQRTGLPVLLNTSFNKRGAPIVETPDEALTMFHEGAMDVLVIENSVLTKVPHS